MKFVEMTGKSLARLINDGELHAEDLSSAGIQDDTIVRVNEQGDIEVRRSHGWDEYKDRIRRIIKLDWA
jgi:hypothetical protein